MTINKGSYREAKQPNMTTYASVCWFETTSSELVQRSLSVINNVLLTDDEGDALWRGLALYKEFPSVSRAGGANLNIWFVL